MPAWTTTTVRRHPRQRPIGAATLTPPLVYLYGTLAWVALDASGDFWVRVRIYTSLGYTILVRLETTTETQDITRDPLGGLTVQAVTISAPVDGTGLSITRQ